MTRPSSTGSSAAGAASFASAPPASPNASSKTNAIIPDCMATPLRLNLDNRRYLRTACRGGILRLTRGAHGDPVPAITRGKQTPQGHQQRAAPDPVHERLVLHAHDPRRPVDLVSKRYVEIARESGIDRRLRHRILLDAVAPFFRIEGGDARAIPGYLDGCARCQVIRPGHIGDVAEQEGVAGERGSVARLYAHVFFRTVAFDQRHTDDHDRHPDMGEHHAIEGARSPGEPGPHARTGCRVPDSLPQAYRAG